MLLCFFFKSGSNANSANDLYDPTIDSLLLQDSLSVDSLVIAFLNKFDNKKKIALVNHLVEQSTTTENRTSILKEKKQTNRSVLWIFSYLVSICLLILLLKRYYQKQIATASNNLSKKNTPSPTSIPSSVKPATAPTTIQPISTNNDPTTINKNALIDQIKTLREKNQTSQRQLTANSLEFIRHENLVKTIGKKLSPVIGRVKGDTRNQLIELSNLVERHQNHKSEWDSFRHFFGQVHPGFMIQLQEQFPELNNNDIRLISFLRLQLTTGEIASLLKVTPSSIHKARYRLKKKLNLDKEVDLDKFLANIAKT